MLKKHKPHILVVDDEAPVRKLLGMALRQHGFKVEVAASGDEAIKIYRRDPVTIELVLLDVQMPGMDGPHTLQALHEVNPHVRCSFMSGNTGAYSEEELLGLGASCVLRKPFTSLNDVADTLARIVDE